MSTKERKTITVTIESDVDMIWKIERWLAWLHFNSHWGHSATVAMDMDGDGSDRVNVTGIDLNVHREGIDKLGGRIGKMKEVEYITLRNES